MNINEGVRTIPETSIDNTHVGADNRGKDRSRHAIQERVRTDRDEQCRKTSIALLGHVDTNGRIGEYNRPSSLLFPLLQALCPCPH